MAKHPKCLDDLTLSKGSEIHHKQSVPLAGKLSEEYSADDDMYWLEKAIEAEKSGYVGQDKTIGFILEKLV
ncbi:MAG: hypothetical protein HQK92_15505 [Nitrospirae bacterium]|nr:hypothetical protein [Nitrospirota bacterium]